MASESSVNGDFMRVDMSTSSLSHRRVVSPIRQRPLSSFSLSPRNTHHLSSLRIRPVGVSNDGQTLVVGPSEANRIIQSGDPAPTLQSAGLAGSPWRSYIGIAGVSEDDPSVICINALRQAGEEMLFQAVGMNPNSVGKEYCREYYNYFNTNRGMLTGLYAGNSVLTFQGVKFLGAEAIVHLLGCLPEGWKPVVQDIDCCGTSDNVDVQVCGAMLTNSDWQLSGPAVELLSPLIESTRSYFRFCQSFHLAKNLEGKYYVVNEIFRLIK